MITPPTADTCNVDIVALPSGSIMFAVVDNGYVILIGKAENWPSFLTAYQDFPALIPPHVRLIVRVQSAHAMIQDARALNGSRH